MSETAQRPGSFQAAWFDGPNKVITLARDGKDIAVVLGQDNADLFTAAPELLEACKLLHNLLVPINNTIAEGGHPVLCRDDVPEFQIALSQANAAIAKGTKGE